MTAMDPNQNRPRVMTWSWSPSPFTTHMLFGLIIGLWH